MPSLRLRVFALTIAALAALAVWLLRPPTDEPPAGIGNTSTEATESGEFLRSRVAPAIAPHPRAPSEREIVTTPAIPPPTILRGKVIWRDNGKPVAGGRIMLFLHQRNGETSRILTGDERKPHVADTGDDGRFELKLDLPRDTEWWGKFYLYAPGAVLMQYPVMALEAGRKLDMRLGLNRASDDGRDAGIPFGPPDEMKQVWETMRAMGRPPSVGSFR